MTAKSKTSAATSDTARKRITLERVFDAPIQDVWDLWTTREGIESWWGPDGFEVKVRKLDLRPGGELLYGMTAVADEQIEFMKRAGMPLTTENRITYTEIVPRHRLVYTNLADFSPGVAAYDVGTMVELFPGGEGVRLVLTLDPMHDEIWTQRMSAGWENELSKLEKVIASRR
jgi:uncharacterized protein YndB with AHSA1/START domain